MFKKIIISYRYKRKSRDLKLNKLNNSKNL